LEFQYEILHVYVIILSTLNCQAEFNDVWIWQRYQIINWCFSV